MDLQDSRRSAVMCNGPHNLHGLTDLGRGTVPENMEGFLHMFVVLKYEAGLEYRGLSLSEVGRRRTLGDIVHENVDEGCGMVEHGKCWLLRQAGLTLSV